jgi:uncharacterized protein YjbI with pentapeptide repeats
MRIVKPMTLGVLSRPYEFRRKFQLGVAVMAFVPVQEKPALLAETGMWSFLAENLPPEIPVDTGMPKRGAEFIAAATAHAPGGRPVASLRAGIQLGACIKTLTIIGDRIWDGRQASPPSPFAAMPITWARAYGGKTFPENPAGRAADVSAASPEIPVHLPNAVYPGEDRPRPAGFGAIDQTWPQRTRLAGTHDDQWLKEDFPGFARDIDWRFFNIAPPDQQFPAPLTGNESYAFENLHPEQSLITGRLPGIAPRLFLTRANDPGFEEIPLALTTVWFFPAQLRMVLIHHGAAIVAEEDASDITHLVAGADPQEARRPAAAFEEAMRKRTARTTAGAAYAMDDGMLVPKDWVVPDPAIAAQQAAMAGEGLAHSRILPRMAREREKMAGKLAAKGLDPEKHLPPLPAAEPAPAPEELPAFIARKQQEAETAKIKAQEDISKGEAKLAAMGIDSSESKAKREAKPAGPPAFTAAGARRRLEAQAARLHELGVDNAAADAEAKLADPETHAGWARTETALRGAYRLGAHHQDKAAPAAAARTEEIRDWLTGKSAPKLDADIYDLHGVDLAWMNLANKNLANLCLDGANLTGSNFSRARLTATVLAHATLNLCKFDGADLTGANLGRAQAQEASFRGAALKKTIFCGSDLSNATFEQADLEGADFYDAILAGARFDKASAPGLILMKMPMREWRAPGIVLDKATFIEVDFSGAFLAGAVLNGVSFIDCRLEGVNFSGARLTKSCFVNGCTVQSVQFAGADLSTVNFRGTAMSNCEFTDANLTGADFSGADLTGALLGRVNATDARFTAAILQNARLTHGNFTGADFARADLRGADLTDGGFVGANLARAKLDTQTRRTGMQMTRMRYLPFHQP